MRPTYLVLSPCFDFLGFSKLTKANPQKVLEIYAKTLRQIQKDKKNTKLFKIKNLISYYWFSDTFVLYTFSDTKEALFALLSASKKFFNNAIYQGELPLRGAITHGKLCTRKKLNIILGEALVDAYEYCESQNWIGLIVTPSLKEKSLFYGYNGDSLWFRNVDVPRKIKNSKSKNSCYKNCEEALWAYAINEKPPMHRRPLIDIIRDMKEKAPEKDKEKYDNTLKFIEGTQYK